MFTKKKPVRKSKLFIGVIVALSLLIGIYTTVYAISKTVIKNRAALLSEQIIRNMMLTVTPPTSTPKLEKSNNQKTDVKKSQPTEPEIEIHEPIEPKLIIDLPKPEEPKIIFDTYTKDSNIKCSSNLTVEQIDLLLEGTDLYGIGEYVHAIEEKNGINAFFTISVASLESGYGSSNLAKNKNNLFGMLGCSFKSRESCVNYFGELINDYEYNYNISMNPNSINTRYCGEPKWVTDVVWLMNHYVKKANEW